MNHPMEILRKDFDALLVDLDGVITKTARVHSAAWKKLFDEFLKKHAVSTNTSFEPFDRDHDYHNYVDGLPRYKGVETFLRSRGISLPYGSPDDDPGQETVCGLGNRKNQYFQEALADMGVERYEPAVAFIRRAKSKGFACAVVSSSKNCRTVLAAAGLTQLFDIRVDGTDIARMGLQGKPDPDMFLEAAKRLEVEPQRAIVIEDAVSGVEAGRNGEFGLVIGVNRSHRKGTLQEHGADWEVTDFGTVSIESTEHANGHEGNSDIPSALDRVEKLIQQINGRQMAVFLDYDGTLTPIVDRPEAAVLSEKMRETIDDLARHCSVAIVSGRDRANVQELVGLSTVIYAGSHGFDIEGPENLHLQHEEGRKSQPALRAAGDELEEQLGAIAGVKIERKAFAVAIHFRLVKESHVPDIKPVVDAVATQYPELRITGGKKILELRPDLDWDKGKAVLWLLQALHLEHNTLPLYIGDDETDEDAFAALKERGIGILVSDKLQRTEARYGLRDPEEVQKFLARFLATWKRRDV